MAIVTIDGIPVYQALVDGADTGMLRISLVDEPAVMSDFQAFAKQRPQKVQMYAVQDEDKHLVLGVVMRADFPIYRLDGDFEYYIIYNATTIRAMAEKYLAEDRQNLVNLMHEPGTDQEGVQMVQYFIKGKGLSPEGFDGIADGSLFAEFHITNEEIWAAIKDGTYKGFSLEGVFDLVPEKDAERVQEIVDVLEGKFSKVIPNKKTDMSKVKGLLARLAKALVEMGNVTTDKGILSWDGEEDLKAGDAVYVEDAEGKRAPAEDGDYTTADGKVISVVDGKVANIADAKAEIAPEEGGAEEKAARFVNTDKGKLEWDNEDEDLKEGDAVYITDEDGNRNPAPDGDYTTEDGKVISVVDGKVASITDTKAEVSEEGTKETSFAKIAQAFAESYEEKRKKIYEAIRGMGFDGWLADAGDDFAVLSYWDNGEKFTRFAVEWDADGNAIVSNPTEVVPAFVTPEERDAADENFRAIQAEKETLLARIAELEKTPAAKPAHEEIQGGGEEVKTGNKGLDKLARIARAR